MHDPRCAARNATEQTLILCVPPDCMTKDETERRKESSASICLPTTIPRLSPPASTSQTPLEAPPCRSSNRRAHVFKWLFPRFCA